MPDQALSRVMAFVKWVNHRKGVLLYLRIFLLLFCNGDLEAPLNKLSARLVEVHEFEEQLSHRRVIEFGLAGARVLVEQLLVL